MEILLIAAIMLLAVALPLVFIYLRAKRGRTGKTPLVANLCCFFGCLAFGCVFLFTQSAGAAEAAASAGAESSGLAAGLGYIAAALSVGLSGIGGGIAVASSASAALGAISENDGVFGKSLIFVGLAEGVALYGLLIAFMIISSL
ncbi:MAG: ATP synthase subunit C [Oscillospiraceae bacterium]|jgi:V/A-type H+-transporting ATPase subunit K|nr:ATP synthase subunit C [Oscillospiraceae bacterium]